MEVQFNPRFGKIYYKYPRFIIDGKQKTVDKVKIYKPSKFLVEAYEQKKALFTDMLKKDVAKDIKTSKENIEIGLRKPIDVTGIVKEVRSRLDYFTKQWRNKLIVDLPLLMAEYNIGESTAKKVKSLIEAELKTTDEQICVNKCLSYLM